MRDINESFNEMIKSIDELKYVVIEYKILSLE